MESLSRFRRPRTPPKDDSVFPCRGFGGLPPSFPRFPPRFLHRIHQPVGGPQGVEGRVFGVVDDQQEMHVVGHDHEIGNGRRREAAVEGDERGLDRLAGRQQRGAALLVDEPRKHGTAFGEGERHEEELQPGMMEVQSHRPSIIECAKRIGKPGMGALRGKMISKRGERI